MNEVINLEPLTCPHCKKEIYPPYFRFCHYCNGYIKDVVDEYQKGEAERIKSAKGPISTQKKPVLMDFSASEISDSSSFRIAFSNALKNSPVISAIKNAYSNGSFEEMREILKESVDTINQLKNVKIATTQFLNVEAMISGEESPVIKLIKNAKSFDATEDDIKTALDVFMSALMIEFLNLTLSTIEKPKNMNVILDNLHLIETIIKPTDFFLLLGFIESFLCCAYQSINYVLRAEDHQKQAIEAFKRAKNDALVTAAGTNLSQAKHLRLWINSFNSNFVKNLN
jgi:hypothetical protein